MAFVAPIGSIEHEMQQAAGEYRQGRMTLMKSTGGVLVICRNAVVDDLKALGYQTVLQADAQEAYKQQPWITTKIQAFFRILEWLQE